MNHRTPGLPVHRQLPEFIQTHVHRVRDAIQPSHPLSSPSPPTFNLSQHQGLFQWVSSLHQVAKVLEFSASASVLPMNIQDWFPLGLTGLDLLFSPRDSQKSSTTPQFKSINCWHPAFFMVQLSQSQCPPVEEWRYRYTHGILFNC